MKAWRWYCRLGILVFILANLLYAYLVERHHIEVTHHRLMLPEWEGDTLRFVVLSDLHVRTDEEAYLRRVVQLALAQKPDAVFLLGDYVNRQSDNLPLEKVEELLRPLMAVPCYAVLGNHDYSYGSGKIRRLFRRLNIPMMEGKVHELTSGSGKLHIAGARCMFTFLHPGTIPKPRPGIPYILLSHSPAISCFAPQGTSLIVSGHTHGGQVCLPFYGAIRMPDYKVERDQCSGLQTIDNREVYISRGIGTSQIPVRYFCRPEMPVLEVCGRKAFTEQPEKNEP